MNTQKVWVIKIGSDFSIEAPPLGAVVVFAITLEEAIDKIKQKYNSKNQFEKGKYWIIEGKIITEVGII